MKTNPSTITTTPVRRLQKFNCLVIALMAVTASDVVAATTGIWTNNNSSVWSTGANWLNGTIPVSAGDTAYITNNITANTTVTIDTPVTLGALNIGDANNTHSFTNVLGGGSLTFNNGGSGAQLNQVSTSKGDTIAAAMVLADDLTISNASVNNLNLSAATIISGSGGLTVNNSGAGQVNLNATNTFSGPVSIKAGVVGINAFSQGTSSQITGGAFGAGNTVTLADGVTLQPLQNMELVATNFSVQGNLNIGVNTNLGARVKWNGIINLNGKTNIVRLARIGYSPAGTFALALSYTPTAAGLSSYATDVISNGVLNVQAHTNLIGTALYTCLFFQNTVNFTNNSGLIIGTNVYACTANNLGGNINSYPNVTIQNGGVWDSSAVGAVGKNIAIASLSGSGLVTNNGTSTTSVLTIDGSGANVYNNTEFTGSISRGPSADIAITKNGSTTQTLSGNNNYTGLSTISAGTLYVTTLNTNGIYNVTGGSLGVKVVSAGTSYGITSLTNAASNISINLNGLGLPTAPVIVNTGGNILKGNVTVNVANKTGLTLGSFVVLTNAGANSRTGAFSYKLGSLPLGVTANLVDNTNAVLINITGISTVTDYLWTGATDNNWNTTSLNWQNDSNPSLAYSDNVKGVIFDDSALSNTTINVTAPYSPTNVLFNNTSKNYVLYGSGKVTGSTALTIQGGGTVAVVNTNDYSGDTKVSNGTLQIGTNGTSGQIAGNITLSGGKLVFARADNYSQPGTVASSSYSSVLYNTASAAGSTNTLTLADGANYWTSLYNNAGSAAQGGVMVVNASSSSTNYFSGTADTSSSKGNSGNFTFGVANTNAGSDFILNGGNYFFTNNAFFATYTGGTLIQSTVFLNGANVYSTYFGTTNSTDGGSHFIRGNLTMNGGSFVTKAWGLAFFVHFANSLVQTFNLNNGTVYVDDSNTPVGATNPVTFYGFTIGNQYGIYDSVLGASAVVNQHNGSVTMAASTNNNVDIGTTVTGGKNSAYLLDGGTLSVFGPNGGNVRLAGSGDSSGSFILTNNGVLQVNGNIFGNASGGAGLQVFSFLGGTLSCSNIDMTALCNALANTDTGTLTNQGGTLEPGLGITAAGKTTVTGNYVCSSAAKLRIDILGATAATSFTNPGAYYDNVDVTGAATVDGNLLVSTNGFTPSSTNSFTILTAGSVSGTFANVTGGRVTVAGSTNTFDVVNTLNSVILTNFSGASSTPSVAPTNVVAKVVNISGTNNIVLSGSGGNGSAGYSVLSTTNLTLPRASWLTNATGVPFGPGGSIGYTNPISAGVPARFFQIRVP